MAPKNSMLGLFRLGPFLLPVFEDHFLVPKVSNDILAISNTDKQHRLQLSYSDLQSCHKLGAHYVCNQFGVQYKGCNQTCLGALYGQWFPCVQTVCEFNIEPAVERIMPKPIHSVSNSPHDHPPACQAIKLPLPENHTAWRNTLPEEPKDFSSST
jgi:hypothetical protein